MRLLAYFKVCLKVNILTFNPGWDESATKLESYDDVRVIQKHLMEKAIKLDSQVEEGTKGPASLTLTDPDGKIILIDQHV